jgi:3-deoxy-D-manno-octulosonic-acid transferase
MFIIYDFIFLIYALIYLPYLLFTNRGYTGFGMRFGLFSPEVKKQIKAKANIWLHAVSVGEVMVIDGFIDQLGKDYPSYQVIATVTTKTGYTLACERLNGKCLVIPSPIDFSFVTRAFVSLIKPKTYIAVETEIWPNLYRQLYLQDVPIVLINGRISDSSFGRYKAIRFLLKGILNQAQLWCMQSQGDANRIMELGADPSRVAVTGNIKFDTDPSLSFDSSKANFLISKDEFWWVAGSTHPGEEDIVLDVYSKVIKDDPRWRLVIAPRHIERVPQIIELITSRGFKAVKFTQLHLNPLDPDGVIVVNTIGQLRFLYSLASLVFVGKSLCVGGGHNVIEPAFYGKAIVIGPKVDNFRDIIACFKESNAMVQVQDARSFEIAVRALCADPSKRETLGAAARAVIAANQGATGRSLERLAEFIK